MFIGDLQNYNFKSTQENRSYRVLALYKAEDPHLDGQEYILIVILTMSASDQKDKIVDYYWCGSKKHVCKINAHENRAVRVRFCK